jgi:hypothetical protein
VVEAEFLTKLRHRLGHDAIYREHDDIVTIGSESLRKVMHCTRLPRSWIARDKERRRFRDSFHKFVDNGAWNPDFVVAHTQRRKRSEVLLRTESMRLKRLDVSAIARCDADSDTPPFEEILNGRTLDAATPREQCPSKRSKLGPARVNLRGIRQGVLQCHFRHAFVAASRLDVEFDEHEGQQTCAEILVEGRAAGFVLPESRDMVSEQLERS